MRKSVLLIIGILLMSLVYAEVTELNHFREGVTNINNQLTQTSVPVNGVNVIGFICANPSCSSISGALWNGNVLTSTGDNLELVYPTELQSPYGYIKYVYKTGYRPYKVVGVTWYGTGAATPSFNYLSKQDSCKSTLSDLDVSASENKVNISTKVKSPITANFRSVFIPSQLTPFIQTVTQVILEIRDQAGNLVHTETKFLTITFSEEKKVEFSASIPAGDYDIQIQTVSDDQKCLSHTQDVKQKDDVTVPEVDLIPVIDSISANPKKGFIPLKVDFVCMASGGNGVLSYKWDFGDNSLNSSMQNTTHTYSATGNFTAKCSVTDSDGDSVESSINIEAIKDKLEISKIECFNDVVETNNQSCSITVKNSQGLAEPGVNVEMFYSDGTLFGDCMTDSITGKCSVKDVQGAPGAYEVYATAKKTFFISDDDTLPKFIYNVLKKVYEITELKVYKDMFVTLASDFFRGENLFVSFKVTLGGNPVENIITKATLVSLPGGRIDLNQVNNSAGEYFYELKPVPKTHEFFGDSNIFTFAFNFSDGSGGQSEINLIIKNNPPVISKIPDKSVDVGETISVDLSAHEKDVEDSGNDLRWEITNVNNLVEAKITGKTLSIKGLEKGTSTIKVRLLDLDNDFDEQEIKVEVKKKTSTGSSGGGGGGVSEIRTLGIREPVRDETGIGGVMSFGIEESLPAIEEKGIFSSISSLEGILMIVAILNIIIVIVLIIVLIK